MSSSTGTGWSPYAFAQLDSSVTVNDTGDVLADAQRQAEDLRESARSEGYAAGYAAGLAAARDEALPALTALAQSGGELARLRMHVIAELEQDALSLAFDLAEQILAGTVAARPERVLDVARHALRHLADRRHVTLIVNPEDLALLTETVPELAAELGGIDHLAVQADRRVARGGAVARTEAGEIDAALGTQLARARELVAESLGGELPHAAALNSSLVLATGTSADDEQ